MISSTEGVGVSMLRPRSEDHIEVVARESLKPSKNHSLWFFLGLNPFQGSMISPEGEFPLGQLVSPLTHEVDSREDFPLVGGIVGLGRVKLLGPV